MLPFLHFQQKYYFKKTIAELLTRMPNIEGVQILQGAQENGKDIVFTTKGPFGENLPCACAVKNIRITGTVGKESSARTILQQVHQALDTPYTNESGEEILVQRAYVISPFPISNSTLISIQGALNKDIGRVIYISGLKLFQLFRSYWPDYFADEISALDKYLHDVIEELHDNKTLIQVAGIYDFNKPEVSLTNLYVQPSFFRSINSYNDLGKINGLIPSTSSLSDYWTVQDVKDSKNSLKVLKDLLNYLISWGYGLTDGSNKNPQDISEMIDNFSSSLENAFIRGAKEHIGVYRLSLGELNEKAKFEFANLESLVYKRGKLELIANKILKPFKQDLLETAKLTKNIKTRLNDWSGLLSDALVLKFFNLDDCINNWLVPLFKSVDIGSIQFPTDLLDHWQGSLLIVGPPGSGKTTFCTWNALTDAQNYKVSGAKLIPIYIQLSQLARVDVTNFEKILTNCSRNTALVGDVSKIILNNKKIRVRLYLDGLDEISDVRQRDKIITTVKDYVSKDKRFQVIITSRDTVYGPYLKWLPRIIVSPLSKEQFQLLINRWLGENTNQAADFNNQLNSFPELKEVMTNPLLATLTILLFKRTQHLPENKARLYNAFTDLLVGGWDLAKGISRESHFGRDVKLMLITELAAHLQVKRIRDFSSSTLKVAARKVFSDDSDIDISRLEKELLIDGILARSGLLLQFSHLSFQEYLAAKAFIGSPKPTYLRKAFKEYLRGDDWWTETLKFYVSLSGHPKELMPWIENEASVMGVSSDDPRFTHIISTITNSIPK